MIKDPKYTSTLPEIKHLGPIRPETFEARRAGESHEFTKRRQKNRIRNKMRKASKRR